MQDPIPVRVGVVLYVFRHLQRTGEVMPWVRSVVQTVSAFPVGNTWSIRASLRHEDGQCEEVVFSLHEGKQTVTSMKTGKELVCTPEYSTAVQLTEPVGEQPPSVLQVCRTGTARGLRGRRYPSFSLSRPETRERNASFGMADWKFQGLDMRVRALETYLSQKLGERETMIASNRSPAQQFGRPERVLHQLRGKMEAIVERPVQNVLTRDEGEVSVYNDVMKVVVDCSLGEYRDLCLAVGEDSSLSCVVAPLPCRQDTPVSFFGSARIRFSSLRDICAILGECDEDELARIVMKARKRRTRASPSIIRIIGDAFIPSSPTSGSLHITAGFCVGDDLISLRKTALPVVKRQSMLRDEVDMCFVNCLEKSGLSVECARQLCAEREERRRTNAVRTKKENKARRTFRSKQSQERGFQLQWVPQNKQGNRNLFEERSRVLSEPGYLELVLPVVFCYGMSQCEELLEVYTPDVLKRCIQGYAIDH